MKNVLPAIAVFAVLSAASVLPAQGASAQEDAGAQKYVVTWWEREGSSFVEHEAAQKRVLELFSRWEMPESITFHQFVVRVGEFGGYMVIETDDPAAIHEMTTAFAAFRFRVEPVLDVPQAVAAEAAAITWRDSVDSGN